MAADIIAVPGNPLKDINTLKEVSFVMNDGFTYRHEHRGSGIGLSR
jgi:imidazolonepropionase-like amidohydrolase